MILTWLTVQGAPHPPSLSRESTKMRFSHRLEKLRFTIKLQNSSTEENSTKEAQELLRWETTAYKGAGCVGRKAPQRSRSLSSIFFPSTCERPAEGGWRLDELGQIAVSVCNRLKK